MDKCPPHHWVIEQYTVSTSPAKCKLCGTETVFSNVPVKKKFRPRTDLKAEEDYRAANNKTFVQATAGSK